MCLDLETSLQKKIDHKVNIGRSMINCRILGYLLHHAPNEEAAKTIVSEVVSCKNDVKLFDLGEKYYKCFIRAFRVNKGRTPIPSNHPSRPSFDTLADMIKGILEEAPRSHATAKEQASLFIALLRDRFRCAITKDIDDPSADKFPEISEEVERGGLRVCFTHCAHIIPESTNWDLEKGSNKLPTELKGANIHRLENVITMGSNVHTAFNRLDIWFSPTTEPNKYKLGTFKSRWFNILPEYVIFRTEDLINLPVPKRDYLELHATCAKVIHLSGAAEYIDKVSRQLEEMTVLSPEGTSADVLEHALWCAFSRAISV
ncbi:hypothetical protein M422DRAFT_165576 [Sphaerobolus stellatus SS14]|uniref:HNH nuclease domain-containing protein n=1 Tax=Sphaerobolus stellatus (strain SS14) TaxID=990650 RepID=A0A0C9VGW3_SPHS4|nr:hypothetical protein M422DRAFT_165576 [Sphaerobolus stellatus SS14]